MPHNDPHRPVALPEEIIALLHMTGVKSRLINGYPGNTWELTVDFTLGPLHTWRSRRIQTLDYNAWLENVSGLLEQVAEEKRRYAG